MAVLVALLIVALGTAAAAWGVRRRLLVVTVRGRSMQPTLWAGDRVLVRRATGARVDPGRIGVFAASRRLHPRLSPVETFVIKRILAVPGQVVPRDVRATAAIELADRVPPDCLLVVGDNRSASYDSRQEGFMPAGRLVGVVLRRL